MSMPYYNSLNRGIKNSSMRDSMRPARPYRSFHSYDAQSNASSSNYDKTRYAPYYQRYYQSAWNLPPSTLNNSLVSQATDEHNQSYVGGLNDAERIQDGSVVLQISNLDPWYDEQTLRNYLLSQLKPITPVYSLTIEGPNLGKVKVPSQQFAKLVVSHLHRKKFGHKRMIVSYLRDMTSAESSAMRCQVSGLLKDVPYHNLPMCKFRELFQSRFKTSISVLDLYRMPDICSISVDQNDEKFVTLHPDLVNNIENTPLAESNQHSVPYCTHHFKQDQDKGWAEIEIDPLPNVCMKLSQVQSIIFSLLKTHDGDIPIASLLFCIEAELGIKLVHDDRGVSLEHLICCVQGVQIKNNSFGIKILAWLEEKENADDVSVTSSSRYSVKSNNSGGNSFKCAGSDSLSIISKEVIELIKMSPKSTMKFNKFIPAYHNHFGKQCRVADYGYTKLIELFEALSSIVQLMGDGENREVTLNHRTQIRRFTTDLLKVLRCQPTKSLNLSNLADAYTATFNRCTFDVTDYGVCDVEDLLEGLKHNNSVVVSNNPDGNDVFLYIQKRKQTLLEIEKTSIFAGEVVELLRKAPQYSALFRKFVRLYHYHFGYQCKLSEYGFLKLSDLMEAISGVIEIEPNNDENRKLCLSRKVAQRVFSEQVHDIMEATKGSPFILKVEDLKKSFKDKYGYQMLPETLGYDSFIDCLKSVSFLELTNQNNELYIVSHLKDESFHQKAYMACMIIYENGAAKIPLQRFMCAFAEKFKFSVDEKTLHNMRHALEVEMVNGVTTVSLNPLMKFVIRLIEALKLRRGAAVHELKASLHVHVSLCHDLGFPNLSSIISAFPDIFKSLDSTLVHERSAIELNKNCILTKMKKTLEIKPAAGAEENKIYTGTKPKYPAGKPMYQSTTRHHVPMDQNFNSSILNSTFMGSKPSMSSSFNNSMEYNRNLSDEMLFNRNSMMAAYLNIDQMNLAANRFPSNSAAALQQQAMQNMQQQLYNNFQEQSNQMFQKMNFCQYQMPENQAISLNHSQIIEQQRMTANHQRKELLNNSVVSNSSCNSSASSYDMNLQTSLPFSILSTFNEPPKPDTPPSMPIPFWSNDPVWGTLSNESSQQNVECLNINIPELKTYNILPVIMSPYVNLSVNNKTIFSFDKPDEKKF